MDGIFATTIVSGNGKLSSEPMTKDFADFKQYLLRQ
jgi:hypothetical protein